MKAFISACVAGVFAFDENKKLLSYKFFEKKPETIAAGMTAFEKGKPFPEMEEVLRRLREKGITETENSNSEKNIAVGHLKNSFRRLALELKFARTEQELNHLIAGVALEQTKQKITKLERRDKIIVHTISAISDLEKILNLMSERLKEWYGLHYPEMRIEHEKLAEAVAKFGRREKFEGFKSSMGLMLGNEDIGALQNYAKQLKQMYEMKHSLEKYLDDLAKAEIPNTSELLGAVLAAKLLNAAGSLEKLAKMPSSTIQLIGSEKAMFRFLKSKGKKALPPKYGLIFLSPYVSNAPADLKGKAARLLASKLAIAVRSDFYTKENRGAALKKELEEKLKEMK